MHALEPLFFEAMHVALVYGHGLNLGQSVVKSHVALIPDCELHRQKHSWYSTLKTMIGLVPSNVFCNLLGSIPEAQSCNTRSVMTLTGRFILAQRFLCVKVDSEGM